MRTYKMYVLYMVGSFSISYTRASFLGNRRKMCNKMFAKLKCIEYTSSIFDRLLGGESFVISFPLYMSRKDTITSSPIKNFRRNMKKVGK